MSGDSMHPAAPGSGGLGGFKRRAVAVSSETL
ncbi:MAG: hypothetical protein QOJ16_2853, partial [Acidobacteriota bacterium]|nr:hypothetical protein [Acidobacteriota bacterium]